MARGDKAIEAAYARYVTSTPGVLMGADTHAVSVDTHGTPGARIVP
jgi:hypothetical protein